MLDLFNRAFFEGPRAEAERELRPGVVERSTLREGRRRCEIDYGDGHVDVFEWQLYLPEELEELGGRFNLRPRVRDVPPDEPSMRLVLERAASS